MTESLVQIKNSLPTEVNLLAVSKSHQASSIRSFFHKGQLDFGESRLQEALPKINDLSDLNGICWHFVGRLQSNKVRGVVKNFNVIHSLHSLALSERIARISEEEGRHPKVFLQIKLREDIAKVGFSKEELLSVWPKLMELPNINIIGLMTIAPITLELNERKKLFRDCRDLANKLKLKECSMGMSNDWREAVEAGATWIRVGSLLFGKRLK